MIQHSEMPAIDVINLGPALSLRGMRMHFDRNEEIFGEGEPADYIYRVVSGAVRKMRITSDGRRQILSFLLPGDIFGLELGADHTLSAEAITECEVVMVRRSVLDKISQEDPLAARCWLKHASDNLARARDHALILGRKGAAERVAAFLLDMSQRLTIETVSRSFTEMERAHAIDLPTSRHVVLRSRAALDHMQAA
jgi:CRP/FNR family transcriptional regulator, nitrogen fixation regulation protein